MADREMTDLEIAKAAIKAMSEDGWMFHGPEGMDDVQKICYDAYVRLGLENACFVYTPHGTKICPACLGAGIQHIEGDTE